MVIRKYPRHSRASYARIICQFPRSLSVSSRTEVNNSPGLAFKRFAFDPLVQRLETGLTADRYVEDDVPVAKWNAVSFRQLTHDRTGWSEDYTGALRCSARLNGRDLRSRDSLLLEARSTTPLVMEHNGGREKGLTTADFIVANSSNLPNEFENSGVEVIPTDRGQLVQPIKNGTMSRSLWSLHLFLIYLFSKYAVDFKIIYL